MGTGEPARRRQKVDSGPHHLHGSIPLGPLMSDNMAEAPPAIPAGQPHSLGTEDRQQGLAASEHAATWG
jgi:hypothetical protein